MSDALHDCCQKATDDNQQRQLVELTSNMERLLDKNRELHMEMVGLMKEKSENDAKMAQMIGKLYEISGDKRSRFSTEDKLEVDENENDVEHVETNAKVKFDEIQESSLGLTGCVKYVLAGILSLVVEKTGINRLLGLFGSMLKPIEEDNNKVDIEIIDDNKETKLKRKRADLDQLWPEEDLIAMVKKKIEGLEDSKNALVGSYWNKKPIINFVNNKAGIKTISDAEDLIRNLSPKTKPMTKICIEDTDDPHDTDKKLPITPSESFEEVMDNRQMIQPSDSFGDNINKDLTGYIINSVETSTPLVLDQVPGVFVFSASKFPDPRAEPSEDITEDEHAEQSMLSLMTFEEKKVYFAQKINEEAAAAMRGSNTPMRSPRKDGCLSPLPPRKYASLSPQPPRTDGSKSPLAPRKDGSVSPMPPRREGSCSPPPLRSDGSLSPMPLEMDGEEVNN